MDPILHGSSSIRREPTDLRIIPSAELALILASHRDYVDSHGANGKRADLSKSNLSCMELTGLNLCGAVLSNADLSGTNLRSSTLRGALLDMCILSRADFLGADLE